jgi:hypothetical protein
MEYIASVLVCKGVGEGRVETPYIYRMIKRALAAQVPLFLLLELSVSLCLSIFIFKYLRS